MKKLAFFLLAVVLVSSLIFSGCDGSSDETTTTGPTSAPTTTEPAPVIELKASWIETNNGLYQSTLGAWIEAVEERTDGRVVITPYFAGQLVPVEDTYDGVIMGTHDIACSWFGAVPGQFPNFEVVEQAKLNTHLSSSSRAIIELYETREDIQEELSETKILSFFGSGYWLGSGLGFTDKEVHNLDDLQGLRLHAVGRWGAKTLEVLGASPESGMPMDLYTKLQRGTLDGGLFTPEMLDTYALNEVVNYWLTSFPLYMSCYVAMNLDTWNSLPADIQQIMEEAADEIIPEGGETYWVESAEASFAKAQSEYGLEVYELDAAEMDKWVAAHQQVRDEWVAEMEANGYNGADLLAAWDAICEKWSD